MIRLAAAALLLAGCAGTVVFPPLTGVWAFDDKLTYQSIHDMDAPPAIPGLPSVGMRVDYFHQEKYIDFNNRTVVVTGYFETDEHTTTYTYPFEVVGQTKTYISIEWTGRDGSEVMRERIYKTGGCYYVRREPGYREYYCRVD